MGLVEIISFARIEIPAKLGFPAGKPVTFADPKRVKSAYPSVPRSVARYFSHNSREQAFVSNGFVWFKYNRAPDYAFYYCFRDQRQTILSQLEPYLINLEGLDEKIVDEAELSPRFGVGYTTGSGFLIPETNYGLTFLDNTSRSERNEGIERTKLAIMGEDDTQISKEFATVGILKYRVNPVFAALAIQQPT